MGRVDWAVFASPTAHVSRGQLRAGSVHSCQSEFPEFFDTLQRTMCFAPVKGTSQAAFGGVAADPHSPQ